MRQIEAFWSPLNGSRHDRIRKLRYPKPVISSRSGELARHAPFGERARDVGKLAFRKSRERDAAGRVPEHDRRRHGSERSLGATPRRASSTEGAALVASACRLRHPGATFVVDAPSRGLAPEPLAADFPASRSGSVFLFRPTLTISRKPKSRSATYTANQRAGASPPSARS